jgi:hypothetical protein
MPYCFVLNNFLKKGFCILLCFFIAAVSIAQRNIVKGKILNEFTNEPFPFASIYWAKAKFGSTTDSAGNFIVQKTNFTSDTLVISYVGFSNLKRAFNAVKDTNEITIYMPIAKMGVEATVKSKFNKGLRWWKNIVNNKANNNPYRFNNYSYELYNKLELDVNNIKQNSFEKIKLLKPFGFVLNNIDSLTEAAPFLPVFLTESLSNYYYSNNPGKVREEIKAVQTHGIKNETVLQFVGGISQKVNVYDDYCNLFGKEFISPLSSNGDKFYNYKGADTQTIAGNKFYHLYFSPKHTGENAFSGDCWIHSTTWAIERITLNTSSTANINFVNRLTIVQEFVMNNNKQWVFAKDKIVADLSPFKKGKISFIGRKTATYKNVQTNQPFINTALAKNKKKEEVIFLEDALVQNNQFWNDNRHETLTTNEANVYHMMDTLKQLPLFKKYTNTIEFIADGHKKFGAIEIGPWYKWISRNQLEHVRTRFDIGTTDKFSNQGKLHSYLAYGFGDERLKGKFDIKYSFPKKSGWSITAAYLDDLDNGKYSHTDDEASIDNMFSQLIRRHGIKQKFLGVKEIKLGVAKEWNNNITTQFSISNANYETFQPLPLKKIFSYRDDDIVNTEFAFKIRYAPGEKKIIGHRRERKLKTKLPVLEMQYAFAVPDIMKSEYRYQKFHLSAQQTFRIKRWGQINYLAYGGKIIGNAVPFMLLEVHPGNEIYYYNKNSFNLMNRFEYMSDEYYGINFEHNIEKKLINLIPLLRKTKIRQFYNIKTVYGDLSKNNRKFNNVEFGGYHLRSLKGNYYTEVGTGFDNIFKFFRIDAVWRFAPTITAANGTVLNTTKQNFGVFGSFKLQF